MPARPAESAFVRSSRELMVIWYAIIAASAVYVVVAFLAIDPTDGASISNGSPPVLDVIFPVLAVALAAGALLFQRANLSEAAIERHGRRSPLAGGQQTDPPRKDLVPLYRQTKIVTWALLEAIGVLGLVLAFLRRTPMTVLPYAVVAVILLMLTRPDLAGFLEQTRTAVGRRR